MQLLSGRAELEGRGRQPPSLVRWRLAAGRAAHAVAERCFCGRSLTCWPLGAARVRSGPLVSSWGPRRQRLGRSAFPGAAVSRRAAPAG